MSSGTSYRRTSVASCSYNHPAIAVRKDHEHPRRNGELFLTTKNLLLAIAVIVEVLAIFLFRVEPAAPSGLLVIGQTLLIVALTTDKSRRVDSQ